LKNFEAGCSSLKDSFWETEIKPKWGTDPGRPDLDDHLWEVAVGGLEAGDAVRITTGGQLVSEARASGPGLAQVSALVTAGPVDGEVTVARISAQPGAATPTEARRLKIHQVLLARDAIVGLRGPCAHL